MKKSELRQLIREEIQSFRESQQSEAYYTLLYKGKTFIEFEANSTSGDDPRRGIGKVNIIDPKMVAYFIKEMDPDNLSTVNGFELVQD